MWGSALHTNNKHQQNIKRWRQTTQKVLGNGVGGTGVGNGVGCGVGDGVGGTGVGSGVGAGVGGCGVGAGVGDGVGGTIRSKCVNCATTTCSILYNEYRIVKTKHHTLITQKTRTRQNNNQITYCTSRLSPAYKPTVGKPVTMSD